MLESFKTDLKANKKASPSMLVKILSNSANNAQKLP